LASALLLFIINLIGLGLGPLFAGIASDSFRQMFLERGLTQAEALGEGLRWSLRIIVAVNLWSAAHYFIAARTLREEEVKG
jgi:hypothetical protein